MTSYSKTATPFTLSFTGDGSTTRLELMNETDLPLKCVEILTVFLKDEETVGAPSRAHLRFEAVKFIQAREKVVMPHKTLIDITIIILSPVGVFGEASNRRWLRSNGR